MLIKALWRQRKLHTLHMIKQMLWDYDPLLRMKLYDIPDTFSTGDSSTLRQQSDHIRRGRATRNRARPSTMTSTDYQTGRKATRVRRPLEVRTFTQP
jgi:hypothetical protein